MVSKEKPLVSVIIPTYKRSDKLSNTILSVLNQTYDNVEIIVVDDNNPDTVYRKSTEDVMKKFLEYKNIKYIKHSKNLNGSSARNTGIENSHGKYLCFLDDDDIYYKNKIERQVEFLEKNSSYDIVYCDRKIGKKYSSGGKQGDLSYEFLSGSFLVITIMIMVRSSAAKNCGGWDTRLKRNQEAAFMLRMFRNGSKIGYLNEVLCETNLDDRSNALNAEKNEKEILKYLQLYNDSILNCKKIHKFAKIRIYSQRHVGILLDYIKEKKTTKSISLFGKSIFKYHLFYIYYLFKYFFKRISDKT